VTGLDLRLTTAWFGAVDDVRAPAQSVQVLCGGMDNLVTYGDRIHYWMAAEAAGAQVADYFQISDPDRLYTGRLFEQVGLDVLADRDPPSYRDPDSSVNRVSGEDLVAVEMLSVQIPPEVSFELLYGELGNQLAGLLAQVPIDVAMADPDSGRHIENGSPADRAWWLLQRCDDMGRRGSGSCSRTNDPICCLCTTTSYGAQSGTRRAGGSLCTPTSRTAGTMPPRRSATCAVRARFLPTCPTCG
jgi:hypothetical protein